MAVPLNHKMEPRGLLICWNGNGPTLAHALRFSGIVRASHAGRNEHTQPTRARPIQA
jgi:hypothetical protein